MFCHGLLGFDYLGPASLPPYVQDKLKWSCTIDPRHLSEQPANLALERYPRSSGSEWMRSNDHTCPGNIQHKGQVGDPDGGDRGKVRGQNGQPHWTQYGKAREFRQL